MLLRSSSSSSCSCGLLFTFFLFFFFFFFLLPPLTELLALVPVPLLFVFVLLLAVVVLFPSLPLLDSPLVPFVSLGGFESSIIMARAILNLRISAGLNPFSSGSSTGINSLSDIRAFRAPVGSTSPSLSELENPTSPKIRRRAAAYSCSF